MKDWRFIGCGVIISPVALFFIIAFIVGLFRR